MGRSALATPVNSVDRQVGQNLQHLRVQRDYSLARLAERMGVTVTILMRYEAGAERVSAERLYAAAAALHVPLAAFFTVVH